MSELDNLRPEVRSALGAIVRADVCRDPVPTDAFDTIRAELLRLTDDCARLVDCINAQPPTRRRLIDRAERAEAELTTLQNTINAQQDTMGALKRKLAIAEAELLRLAGECAMIPRAQLLANFAAANERAEKAEADLATAKNTIDAQQDTMGALKRKLALVEAELAAVRAKIEGAPLTTFRRAMLGTPHACVEEKFACPEWIGKRVRLVVEK